MPADIDKRFIRAEGAELFNGNELLVKGALEAEGGIHLITGYPGSPLATIFDVLSDLAPLLREKGIEGQIANNEAVAVAAVNGTQMGPLRAMAALKSVGGHVGADGLALGNLAGAHPEGGVVIVFGDDPWSDSTQVPADSRFLCKHLRMPCLEPATPQEVKDFVGLGFQLSRATTLYSGFILTTPLADGGSSVQCRPNHYPLTNRNHPFTLDTGALDTTKTVLLPPRTGAREETLHLRFAKIHPTARELGLDREVFADAHCPVGIVTTGMAWQYTGQALEELDLYGRVPILKIGLCWPLDSERLERFAERFEHLVVIEERRGFLEEQVAGALLQARQRRPDARFPQLWGKTFPAGLPGVPAVRGLTCGIVTDRLGRLWQGLHLDRGAGTRAAIGAALERIERTAQVQVQPLMRTPTFCPGCPHRDSSSVLLEMRKQFLDPRYMRRKHGRGPIDLVCHGDTGCYTMLMFAPNSELMHNYSGMGLGGATGSGIDPFITNKQIVFMGDSTFFHSGQIAISNAVKQNQDITFIILDNKTTAMTGHQTHPGVDYDVLGRPTFAQDIEQIVRAITGPGRCTVVRTNPEDRAHYKRLLEQTILSDGVKVIIADKECGIELNRRRLAAERSEQRKRGFLRRKVHMNITQAVCEFCHVCARHTGCPGLNFEQTDYGPKMTTDLSWCVNDGACAKLEACPAFEQVVIIRKRPPLARGREIKLEDLPEPAPRTDGDVWRCWLAGIGGMGIGVAASILVYAGQHAGWNVSFADKKGLAIRNGGVYSQVVFTRSDRPAAQTIPYGKADLLVGLDALEAARAVDPRMPFRVAAPDWTATVLNTDKTPTAAGLCVMEDFDVAALERVLRSVSRPGAFFAQRINALCERLFGTKLYANITMLGVAWQMGLIPVPLESLKEGIRRTIRADFKENMRALNLGRKLVAEPELFREQPAPRTLARTVREKAIYLNMRRLGARKALAPRRDSRDGKLRLPQTGLARQYKHLVYTTLRACRELDRDTMRDVAVRIYDLIQWGGARCARRYARRIRRTFLADDQRHGFAATRAVIWNLARLMLVKDEFYVAQLLTSYEKLRRDRQRYNINAARGDKIRYRRTFHPRIFGHNISISLPHWTLYALRRLRWLRNVLPFYHHADYRLLARYEALVDRFEWRDDAGYGQWLAVLGAPETVAGYREQREPGMAEVRKCIEAFAVHLRAAAAPVSTHRAR